MPLADTLMNFISFGCKKISCGIYLPFLSSNRKDGVWGCNWSVNKAQLIAINGFDEDYIKGGVGEDTDIEWRLRENGSSFCSVKFHAIQYHFQHSENYPNGDVENNFEILKNKKNLKKKVLLQLFFYYYFKHFTYIKDK